MNTQQSFYHHYGLLSYFSGNMWRAFAIFVCIITAACCAGAAKFTTVSPMTHPSVSGERVCLSLRVLAIEAAKNSHREEVATLAGIGWLEGFAVDPQNHDLILFGLRSSKWPSLHLDDLVVNIRNIWNGDTFPYCSLDPRPQDVTKVNQTSTQTGVVTSLEQMRRIYREIKEAWGPQQVIVGGVPRKSRHAHTMIAADYHMKKLSQGLVEVEGIRSIIDIALDNAKQSLNRTGQIPELGMSMARFWFHVGNNEPTYQEDEGIIVLDKCSVVVLTEKQRATVDGMLYDSGGEDPYAVTFARELSDNIREIATGFPEYANLENLFRLSAILHAMHFRNVIDRTNIDMSFYLNQYRYGMEKDMPQSLPGLTNHRETRGTIERGRAIYQYIFFPIISGGVSMEIEVVNANFEESDAKRLNRLRDLAFKARPNPEALSWLISE